MGLTEVRLDTLPPERFRELIGERFDALEPMIAPAITATRRNSKSKRRKTRGVTVLSKT